MKRHTLFACLILAACAQKNSTLPSSESTESPLPPAGSVESRYLNGELNFTDIKKLNENFQAYYADIERAAALDRGLPHLEQEKIEQITNKFGRSRIDISQLPYQSPVLDSGKRPWSSWWYPNFESTLFRSPFGDAPLQKYDLFRDYLFQYRGQSLPVRATTLAEKSYNQQSLRWEGLCDAWALASIISPEPLVTRQYNLNGRQVQFSPTDLKALLLKTYEAVPATGLEVYGQKFTGEFDAWIHPDPLPDQFHRFIETVLGTHKRAFVMDHDPGIEIWNVPVFKANYNLYPVEGRDDAVRVRMWLYTASPLNKNEISRQGLKETVREYHYILFGNRVANELEINSGMWIVGDNGTDSRRSHPDYFIDIPDPTKIRRQSYNGAIDIGLVDALIKGDVIR